MANMAGEQLFQVGVKALIENSQGQILLLKANVSSHRKNTEPYWDIPGGRIQEDNTVIQTLAREVEEETGIYAFENPELLTAVMSNHKIPISDSEEVGLLLVVYKVTVADDVGIILSPEHTEYEWVTKAQAALRLGHKYPKEFTDALANGADGQK